MSEYDKIADRASHTPPPWDNWGLTIWQQWDGRKICHMAGMSLNPAENKANTDLVKAAPELLAALEGMQQANGCFDDCRWEYSGRHHSICLEARAAIAKARGSV